MLIRWPRGIHSYFFYGVILLIMIGLFLGFHNLLLRYKIKGIKKTFFIYNTDYFLKKEQQKAPNIKIINNGDKGIWDRMKKRDKLTLVPELVIGEEEGDSLKTFYRIGSVIADEDGNIYVCEVDDGHIKKFNKNGDYLLTISRKGSSPGELYLPGLLRFDNNKNLCVLEFGNQRISTFSCMGTYLGSLKLEFRKGAAGFVIDELGLIYISTFDSQTEKIIHKYNQTGDKLVSFGDPVYFPKSTNAIDKIIQANISIGPLLLFGNELYFSIHNPYEIRKYTRDGQLIMKIFRKNEFMLPPKIFLIDKKTIQFKVPAMSTFLGKWNDKIINVIEIPDYLNLKVLCVIDIFDLDGQLLTSIYLTDNVRIYYIDSNSRLYGCLIDQNGVEKVVRFQIKSTNNR